MSTNFPYFMSGDPAEVTNLRRNRESILTLGILMMLVATLAIGYGYSFVWILYRVGPLGFLLVLGGTLEVVGAFRVGRTGLRLLHLLCGLLCLCLGGAVIGDPRRVVGVYTPPVAVFFVAAGLFRLTHALTHRFSGWGWGVLNGAVGLFLGVLMMLLVDSLSTGDLFFEVLRKIEVFGFLLVIGGAFELVGAFSLGASRTGRFPLHLLCGLLSLFLGLAVIDGPRFGTAGYVPAVAVFFAAAGLFRLTHALTQRFSGWGWVLFNGAVSLFLGVLIWRQPPEAARGLLGLFVGIDLLSNGLSWVILALAVRPVPPGAPATDLNPART